MNVSATWAITLKVFRTLRRDKRSLALIVVAPVLAMFVFGIVFGTDISGVTTVVVNQDAGVRGAELISHMDRETLDLRSVASEAEAARLVRDGDAWAAIVIPEEFTQATSMRRDARGNPVPPAGTDVALIVDASNAQMASAVATSLQDALRATFEEAGAGQPVTVQDTAVYADGARYIDFFVPGIISFAAFLFTAILTLLAFVGERTSGTLSRLRVSPATDTDVVLGYALAFGLVAAVQGLILLGVAIWAFDVLVTGSLALAAFVLVLLAVDSQALGILLSAAAKQEAQAVQFLPLIVFPVLLLSGIFVPLETLPDWLQPFAWVVPPSWAVEALRSVMLRGWGLDRIWPHLAVLAGLAALFLGLAVAGLKRQRA